MKITVTYTEGETDRAAAVILALTQIYPFRQKTTPVKDGYIHTYITFREPFPVMVGKMLESTGEPCSDNEKMV